MPDTDKGKKERERWRKMQTVSQKARKVIQEGQQSGMANFKDETKQDSYLVGENYRQSYSLNVVIRKEIKF